MAAEAARCVIPESPASARFRRYSLRFCGTALITLVLAGVTCGPTRVEAANRANIDPRPLIRQDDASFVRAPNGFVFDWPVWVASREILVVAGATAGGAWNSHLHAIRLGGSGFRRLPIANERGCSHTSQDVAIGLSNGTIAYLQTCWGDFRRLPGRAKTLFAYDPARRLSIRLRSSFLPFGVGTVSLSPSRDRVVISDRSNQTLAWLNQGRLIPLKLPLADALDPSWAPNGRSIALTGVRERPASSDSGLYLLSADGKRLQSLVPHLDYAGSAAWSPDSRRLVAAMKPRNAPAGLWLVEVSTGAARLLLGGTAFAGATWLPDGRTVVATTGSTKIDFQGSTPRPKYASGGFLVFKLPDSAVR